jgi:hypothetical protein
MKIWQNFTGEYRSGTRENIKVLMPLISRAGVLRITGHIRPRTSLPSSSSTTCGQSGVFHPKNPDGSTVSLSCIHPGRNK